MTDGAILLMAVLLAAAVLTGVMLGRMTARPAPLPPVDAPPVDPDAAAPDSPDRISVDILTEPVLVVDGARVVAANAPARQLFGERVLGRDLGLTVRHPVVLDALDQARRDRAGLEREAAGLGAPDSLWRLRIVPADAGRLLLLFHDLTPSRLTERMRADFVANASHELRTPLATLSGFIETLQGAAAEDEPARNRFLAIMADEAQRMRRLIDDLMSLSRIELDKYIRPTKAVALVDVIDEVDRALAMQLAADGRTLVRDIAPDLPPVRADRDQIVQVMQNLMINALKYGRTGTPITVQAQCDSAPGDPGPMVSVSVADQGEGIAAEHLPRLTERFYRVDSQRSRTMGGTGLGLAIVKHIVERHRGRLRIDSRQGEGTRVSFTLPVASTVTEVQ